MLSERHRQHYEQIQQMVHHLQEIAVCHLGIGKFQAVFLKMQQIENSLSDEDLEVKAQSYQTEINKQLRLLEIDLMFLKTARQVTTSEQRWALMGDRLHLLGIYCETLLSQDF